MCGSHKVPIHEIRGVIKEISIMHRTGQTRVITNMNEVIDVKFKDLVESLNTVHQNFSQCIRIKYCPFSEKQLDKLVTSTCYTRTTKTIKNKELGFLETYIEFKPPAKQKQLI